MKIAVIGLGLIGGSIARRLRGFEDSNIYGFDHDIQTLETAKSDGVITDGFTDGKLAINDADLIILCLYPQANIDFIKEYGEYIKKTAVVTDVSGVKGYIAEEMNKILPPSIDFIGGHPMAGREVGGYQSSTDTLFDKASYIITPTINNKSENIALVRSLAKYIGCQNVITTTPSEHDDIIAYTSQLMHVVAVALCDSPMIERSTFFSAGSLRDCTRVAIINETMWSELFLENKDALVDRIDEMQDSLEKMKTAIKNSDRKTLENIMINAKSQKLKWLIE